MRLLIATTNPGKRREMRALLEGLPVEIMTPDEVPDLPEVVEDGDTPAENAARKARQTAAAAGMCAVADDSGLFVDALDGRPGVHSARYAGPDPTPQKLCTKLLSELDGVPAPERSAHFLCCIALGDPDGRLALTARGRVDGRILKQMVGHGGFGYDPVFYYEPAGKTFAQMQPEDKNAVSHRGRALQQFGERFRRWLQNGDAR
ncbi:MAG: XTP/dITP diphosphatase [Candidatus Brocadiia bacterium]